MSLRDHFVEKATGDSGSVKGPDGWALKYINIGRAPSILEAFDDDASGCVTTRVVNDFSKSRPLNWGCAFLFQTHEVCSLLQQTSSLDSVLGDR